MANITNNLSMEKEKKLKEEDKTPLILSDLQNLTFGPDWSIPKNSSSPETEKQQSEDKKFNKRKERNFPAEGSSKKKGHHLNHDFKNKRDGLFPNVSITFYPQEKPLNALINAVRKSHKTYQLFEIVHLILKKPECFVVILHSRDTDDKENKEEECNFYVSVCDGLPFETELEAINHILNNHLHLHFDTKSVEVEPPKGSFQMINRCLVTGELLGPPNYHRYQQIVQAHYNKSFSGKSKQEFEKKIESVKDEKIIQKWIQKMTVQTHYIYKHSSDKDDNPLIFEDLEKVRHYLLSHNNIKKNIIRSCKKVRFSGSDIKKLPKNSNLCLFIENALKEQRHFPLNTANHLRGRFRKLNFAVYKKGKKGVTYICAVKRRFRQPGQVFSNSMQTLIDYIEKNPDIHREDLQKAYLKQQTKNLQNTDATPESQVPLSEFSHNLHWLVSEGYIVECSDGRISIPKIHGLATPSGKSD
jgi:hypothetical protein